MKCKKYKIKFFLTIFMLLSLSMNSLAAVVSDNDGSAFITKAEFDSLKNTFQAQVNNYNQSIDSKIDGAIASYLAGIKVNTEETPQYKAYGASGGTLDGRQINKIYIVTMGVCSFDYKSRFTSTSTGKSYGLHLWKGTKDYRPKNYGPGYWVTGFDVGGKRLKVDETCLPMVCMKSWSPSYSSGSYGGVGYIWILDSLATGTTASFTNKQWREISPEGTTISYNDYWSHETVKNIYVMALSDAYEQRISIVDPEIKLFEFQDGGDVSFDVQLVRNGKAWETAKGTGVKFSQADSYGTVFLGAKTPSEDDGSMSIYRRHGDTDIELLKLQPLASETWTTITTTVNPGDSIVIIGHAGKTNSPASKWPGTGSRDACCYDILISQNTIPGWDKI